MSAAIPLLRLAQSVQIVSVDRQADRRSTSQTEVVAYLHCHGITANPRVVAPHLRSVGDTLLAVAGVFTPERRSSAGDGEIFAALRGEGQLLVGALENLGHGGERCGNAGTRSASASR